MPDVVLEQVTKHYPDGAVVLDGVDLRVADGEFFAIIGPSGSGKSTLLRVIAGLEQATSGVVRIDGRDVTDVHPSQRDVSFVFQEGALYPNMTVSGNLAFPLEVRKTEGSEVTSKVAGMARSIGAVRHLEDRPGTLSAGMRQGVATGRALLAGGHVLLMDEPLSNLDDHQKMRLRRDLQEMKRRHTPTIVYVTNDQAEAMLLADRVAVIAAGAVRQVADPRRVYDEPADIFVAEFLGDVAINLARGAVAVTSGEVSVMLGDRAIRMDDALEERLPALLGYAGSEVVVAIRPERLRWEGRPGAEQRLGGVVRDVEFLGHESIVHFEMDAPDARGWPAVEFRGLAPSEVTPAVGEHVAFAIDPADLLFFDPDRGTAISERSRADRGPPTARGTAS